MMNTEGVTIPLFRLIDGETVNSLLGLSPTLIGVVLNQSQFIQKSSSTARPVENFLPAVVNFLDKVRDCLLGEHVRSQIVGFILHSENSDRIEFYSSDAASFVQALGKILNMKGFQEMFRPIRKLGRGNFATVYEAERNTDHQKFAVKAFSKQNSYSSKNGRQSLMNELSLLRSLNVEPHPNVLRLEAVYESENSIYVVLELLEGKTLLETMQERKGVKLQQKQVKKIMEGLLKGIAHLCKNRVMHRDLKPENIMIRKETFEPVIVDFGLSTNVDLPEYLFFRCGTPGYVAPEVIRLTQSVHLEPTCDIFSLGAVFHVLLTNRALFPGVKYDQVYRANKQFIFSFQNEMYKTIGQKAMNLLKNLLVLDATQRITAQAALIHPYFMGMQQQQSFLKEDSPVLTVAASSDNSSGEKKKKKKRFFFF